MLLVAVLTCLLWPAAVNGQIASNGDLRIVDGTSSSGRLEVYYFGVWGTVCDDGFGSSEALVACRQLGFSSYSDYGNVGDSQFRYPQGVSNIWLDGVSCFGSEARLQSCSHNSVGSHNCRHNEDVAVSCFGLSTADQPTASVPEPGSTGSARLVARDDRTSPSLTAGRLEVYYNGQWGTVCDDGFGSSEAEVICRQLGFSGYITFGTVGSFGIGFESASSSTPIWLDSFSCSITDSSLSDCSIYEGIGVHNCNHNEDIALFCLGNGALRLSPGTSSGRLEIYYNGEWGTVCDDLFGQNDADVACRQLGFASASNYGSVGSLGYSRATSGTEIWLDDLQCTSSDLMLSTCSHDGFGNENCGHSEDVAVSCTSAESIGLSGGAIVGIVIGILAPCCCIGICVIVICVAIGSGAFSSKSTNRGGNCSVVTTTTTTTGATSGQVPQPYPKAPSATAPPPTTGTTQSFQLQPTALAQEPPPPYPGTQNTYPVQPQPGAQYPAYPQGSAPYPNVPYQPYSGAPPTVGSALPPQPYPTEAPPTTVASAPPPQPSAYQQHYAMSAQPTPYPLTIPGQAVYPTDPTAAAYPSAPAGTAPAIAGDPNQGYPPPTN